jgi:hypothetical protein
MTVCINVEHADDTPELREAIQSAAQVIHGYGIERPIEVKAHFEGAEIRRANGDHIDLSPRSPHLARALERPFIKIRCGVWIWVSYQTLTHFTVESGQREDRYWWG